MALLVVPSEKQIGLKIASHSLDISYNTTCGVDSEWWMGAVCPAGRLRSFMRRRTDYIPDLLYNIGFRGTLHTNEQ